MSAGAAAHPAVAVVRQGERIELASPPPRRGPRPCARRAPGPSRSRSGSGPDPGDHVGLAAVRGAVARDPHARAVQVVAEEIGDRQVAVPAGRVEADQAGEQLGVGEEVRQFFSRSRLFAVALVEDHDQDRRAGPHLLGLRQVPVQPVDHELAGEERLAVLGDPQVDLSRGEAVTP